MGIVEDTLIEPKDKSDIRLNADLNFLIKDLGSSSIEIQISAIKESINVIEVLITKIIDEFKISSNPFLIAERLYQFGSILVPYLKTLFQETESTEHKVLSAIVLLRFDCEVGIDYLLEELITNRQYPVLIADCLAHKDNSKLSGVILKRLRAADVQEVDLIIGLVTVLEEMLYTLPDDLYQRYKSKDVPWQLQTLINLIDTKDKE